MDADLVIRGGLVVDGTGAAPVFADVVVAADRIVAIEPNWSGSAVRVIDAAGRIVTPGFVDIHAHLDAQFGWDPLATSSCWHGITSVVIGNCGVTFAPVEPGGKEFLAEMMESVEDIPRDAILNGLPWDWTTYGEYLDWLDRTPKGINVGGMVGHCAVRFATMGERALSDEHATADDIAAICESVEAAMKAGALGFSTSRTPNHLVPDGRPVPGTTATHEELIAIGDVLGRLGSGVFESVPPADMHGEMKWMGEVSRRSGRPLTFVLLQDEARPGVHQNTIDMTMTENATGATLRPQTTARGLGLLYGIAGRTPFGKAPSWLALRGLDLSEQLTIVQDPQRRRALIDEGDIDPGRVDPAKLFVLPPGPARYDCPAEDSLAAHAARRGVSPTEAFIDLVVESGGRVVVDHPFRNQSFDAVEEMLDEPTIVLGLADAGAHVGQIMDASQPTFVLTYWVRERKRWPIEEAVRRMTSDTATLFGIKDRGVLRAGAYADINVIDFDALTLHQPEFVHDFPGGAGRYVQYADGYAYTIVNGQVFMENGTHTGALAGRVMRGELATSVSQ